MSEWMICGEAAGGEKKEGKKEKERGQESNRNIIRQLPHSQQREIQSVQVLNVLLMSELYPSSGTRPVNGY